MKERRFQEILNRDYGGDREFYERQLAIQKEQIAKESFGGDRVAADIASQELCQYTLYWQDIVDAATILPELKSPVHELIARRLGYTAPPAVQLEYEPFLRTLLKNYFNGALTDEAFSTQVETEILRLRNEDMQANGWVDQLTYSDAHLQWYDEYLALYKQTARKRIVQFLGGYEPPLLHSLEAELWLRQALAREDLHFDASITEVDIRALTVIIYRSELIEQGQAAADATPLLGRQPAVIADMI